MVAIPTTVVTIFVIIPTILSIIWSFGTWNGIGDPLTRTNWVGLWNYEILFTKYPFFWPAVQHNIIWLVWLAVLATPLGMFLAVLLDKNIRGTRFYQLPVRARFVSSSQILRAARLPKNEVVMSSIVLTRQLWPTNPIVHSSCWILMRL